MLNPAMRPIEALSDFKIQTSESDCTEDYAPELTTIQFCSFSFFSSLLMYRFVVEKIISSVAISRVSRRVREKHAP